MTVVIYSVVVLHLMKASLILLTARELQIIDRQFASISPIVGHIICDRNHTLVYGSLIGFGVTTEQLAKAILSEVASVIEHDVEYYLHSPCMCLVDEPLEVNILRDVVILT